MWREQSVVTGANTQHLYGRIDSAHGQIKATNLGSFPHNNDDECALMKYGVKLLCKCNQVFLSKFLREEFFGETWWEGRRNVLDQLFRVINKALCKD